MATIFFYFYVLIDFPDILDIFFFPGLSLSLAVILRSFQRESGNGLVNFVKLTRRIPSSLQIRTQEAILLYTLCKENNWSCRMSHFYCRLYRQKEIVVPTSPPLPNLDPFVLRESVQLSSADYTMWSSTSINSLRISTKAVTALSPFPSRAGKKTRSEEERRLNLLFFSLGFATAEYQLRPKMYVFNILRMFSNYLVFQWIRFLPSSRRWLAFVYFLSIPRLSKEEKTCNLNQCSNPFCRVSPLLFFLEGLQLSFVGIPKNAKY